jgi:hypothetical protein
VTEAQRAERILLGLYLAAIPVHWSPFPWNIQWSEVVFAGLLIVVLARGGWRSWSPGVLDGLVILYLAGPIVSLFTTTDIAGSVLQYAKHLYLAAVYLVVASLTREESSTSSAIRWCAVVGSVVAAVSLFAVMAYQLWGVQVPLLGVMNEMPYVGRTFRPYGPMSSAAYLANYLTFSLPMVLALGLRATRLEVRLAWRGAALALAGAAVATLSPTAGGLFVAGVVYLWPYWTESPMGRIRWAAAVMMVMAVVALNVVSTVSIRAIDVTMDRNQGIAPPPYAHGLQDGRGAERIAVAVTYNVVGYLMLKKIAWEAFERHPLTGIGLGRFHEETERAYREGQIPAPYRAIDPHSTLLGRLAETGLFGGLTLVGLWAGVVWLGLQAGRGGDAWGRRAAFAAIVGLLVNAVNVDVMNFRFLWVGFALLRAGWPARSGAV